jgi:phosphatidate cytidylyltransferase
MNKELIKRILSSIILIPITLFFILKGSIFFNFFLLVCFFLTVFEWHKISKKTPYSFIGSIFFTLSFYSIYSLRNEFGDNYLNLLFVTIICIATDIGGYVFGKIFKGPKLTKISPKKTYAGTIGGFFLSIISINFFLTSNYLSSSIKFSKEIFVFVILISLISQFGDILISYFKRKSKIKDTGKIIPGHGGLLDRIDGMLFAFPFAYILFSIDIINIF